MKTIIVVLSALVALTVSVSAAGTRDSAEAVVMACTRTGPQTFHVERSSSSDGAPVLQHGDSCAQAVATLARLGFRLKDARDYIEGNQQGVLYTFITGGRD
jgi:hypothetical protein